MPIVSPGKILKSIERKYPRSDLESFFVIFLSSNMDSVIRNSSSINHNIKDYRINEISRNTKHYAMDDRSDSSLGNLGGYRNKV